jgi:hypothetical protein
VENLGLKSGEHMEKIHRDRSCADILRKTDSIKLIYQKYTSQFTYQNTGRIEGLKNFTIANTYGIRNLYLYETDTIEDILITALLTGLIKPEKEALIVMGKGKEFKAKEILKWQRSKIEQELGNNLFFEYTQLGGGKKAEEFQANRKKLSEEMDTAAKKAINAKISLFQIGIVLPTLGNTPREEVEKLIDQVERDFLESSHKWEETENRI